jgi:hypothetical protein
MASPWLDLDAALELIGRDRRDALVRGCLDGDVKWRARDDSGALLESPRWTEEVDWSTSPPRFAIADPYMAIVSRDSPLSRPAPAPVRWCVAEVERQSLLRYFDQTEPLAVRVVEPVSVILRRAATMVARLSGRKSSGQTRAPEIIDEFQRIADRGEVSYKRGGLTAAARQLTAKFPDYTEKHIAELITPAYQHRRTKAGKT